jgi:hypothetical protein
MGQGFCPQVYLQEFLTQLGCWKASYWMGDGFSLAKGDDLRENGICSPIHPMNFSLSIGIQTLFIGINLKFRR